MELCSGIKAPCDRACSFFFWKGDFFFIFYFRVYVKKKNSSVWMMKRTGIRCGSTKGAGSTEETGCGFTQRFVGQQEVEWSPRFAERDLALVNVCVCMDGRCPTHTRECDATWGFLRSIVFAEHDKTGLMGWSVFFFILGAFTILYSTYMHVGGGMMVVARNCGHITVALQLVVICWFFF